MIVLVSNVLGVSKQFGGNGLKLELVNTNSGKYAMKTLFNEHKTYPLIIEFQHRVGSTHLKMMI